jgi:hypothetical protein
MPELKKAEEEAAKQGAKDKTPQTAAFSESASGKQAPVAVIGHRSEDR